MERSWLERHPRWKIPLGLVIGAVLLFGFTIGVMTLVVTTLRHSEVYQQAFARASASPQVRASLGDPLQARWLIAGKLNVNGNSGNANLSIPIDGPKGSGAIRVVALKSEGVWRFEELQVRVDGQRQCIDLLKSDPERQ